jgi:hypothetical protein
MSKYKLRLKRQRRRQRARARQAATPAQLSPVATLILNRIDQRIDELFGTERDGLLAGLKSNTN